MTRDPTISNPIASQNSMAPEPYAVDPVGAGYGVDGYGGAESGIAPRNHPDLDFLSSAREDEVFEAAQRHSALVKTLRVMLPVVGGLIIVGFIVVLVASLSGETEVSIENVGIDDGKLVMDNPKLTGTDSDKRPYSMTAEKAWQDVENPTLVTLDKISAQLTIDEKNTAQLIAGSGLYNTENQQLNLGDEISLETEDGIKINMKNAAINIAEGTLDTNQPVDLSSKEASISAGQLNVQNKGEMIIFDGGVRITVNPGAFDRGQETN